MFEVANHTGIELENERVQMRAWTGYLLPGVLCMLSLTSDVIAESSPIPWETTQSVYWEPRYATATEDIPLLELDPAWERFSAALEEAKRGGGSNTLWLTRTLNALAEVCESRAEYEAAERALDQALAIDEKVVGSSPFYVIWDLHNLADLSYRRGKFKKAGNTLRQAINIIERLLRPDPPQITMSFHDLMVIWGAQGRYADAQEDAIKILTTSPDPYRTFLNIILQNYRELLQYLNK